MNDEVTYDGVSIQTLQDAMNFIPFLTSKMRWVPNEFILDFGCGSGLVTKNILLKNIDKRTSGKESIILAVDISQSAVDIAWKIYPHPRIDYNVMNIDKENMEFRGSLNKIFALHSLQWIPDKTKTLQNFHKLLNFNGQIGVYFFDLSKLLPHMWAAKKDPVFGHLFHGIADTPNTPEGVELFTDPRTLFENNGFKVLRLTKFERSIVYENKDGIIDFVLSVGVSGASPDQMSGLREFIAETFAPWYEPAPTSEMPSAVRVGLSTVIILARKVEPKQEIPEDKLCTKF